MTNSVETGGAATQTRAQDIVRRLRGVSSTEIETMYNLTREAAADIHCLAAQLAAAERDAEARSLYDRTAAAHGFINAPHWNDLAEETRQMYRDERAKRDALERT